MRPIHCATCFILAGAAALAIGNAYASLEPQEERPPAEKPATEMNALETRFAEAMTNAVLRGRWRMLEDGRMGEEQEDKYTIASAKKVGAGKWVLAARIEYGGKDVTVPIPLDVHWAGDTPVLSLTNAGIPGLGTYSARVIVHDGTYAGTWSGPGCGGFVAGVVEKLASGKKPDAKDRAKEAEGVKSEAPKD
jgi:hypothetical protein